MAILVPASFGVAAAKARPPPLRIVTVRGTCRAGRPRWRERGAGYPTLVSRLGSVFSFLRECHRPLAAGAFPPFGFFQRAGYTTVTPDQPPQNLEQVAPLSLRSGDHHQSPPTTLS